MLFGCITEPLSRLAGIFRSLPELLMHLGNRCECRTLERWLRSNEVLRCE
jgi:hypothetical protein